MSLRRSPLRSRAAREWQRPASPAPVPLAVAPNYGGTTRPLVTVTTPSKASKPSGKREQAHMGKVASIGCLICRRLGYEGSPAEVHHLREGQGGAQRASGFLTIPLCPEHHRGASGLHGLGTRMFERRYGVDELGLLAETIAELTS